MKENKYILSEKATLAIRRLYKSIFKIYPKNITFNNLISITKAKGNNGLEKYLNNLMLLNPNLTKNSFKSMSFNIKMEIIKLLNLDLNNMEFKSIDERILLLFLLYKSKNGSKKYASRVKVVDILNLRPDLKLSDIKYFKIKEISYCITYLNIIQINFLINLLEN